MINDYFTVNNWVRNLEHKYYGLQDANPEWDKSLWDFLVESGIEPYNIWNYKPQIGIDANQPEPDWL